MSYQYSPDRPGCITAYAVFIWLGGALFALGTVSLILDGEPAALFGITVVILAAFVGYGLWHMRQWSWWLVIILQSLSLLGSLFGLVGAASLGTGFLSPLAGVAVSVGILYWFVTNRSLFTGEPVYRTVVGPDGETRREQVQSSGTSSSNKTVIIVVSIVLLVCIVPVVTIAVLTLLGPQIGDVFSRIVTGLESTPMP